MFTGMNTEFDKLAENFSSADKGIFDQVVQGNTELLKSLELLYLTRSQSNYLLSERDFINNPRASNYYRSRLEPITDLETLGDLNTPLSIDRTTSCPLIDLKKKKPHKEGAKP